MAASPYCVWLEYFERRRGVELDAPLQAPFLERPGRAALARSLARFELGESGDGARIRGLAEREVGATYARAVKLFVAEEAQHARWLTILRERFAGERIDSHWSDRVFVVLRHTGGLRREILVLLTAEIIALSYYRVLALAYDDPVLSAACERILVDERGHVAFHEATLGRELARMAPPARGAALLAWRSFVAVTASVVAFDHRKVLALAGVTQAQFARVTRGYASDMCRNIRTLYNFEPPATEDEVRAAALQYVRKISGFTKPSAANAEAFEQAVDAVADVSRHLLDALVTSAPQKDRETEAAKARARRAAREAAEAA